MVNITVNGGNYWVVVVYNNRNILLHPLETTLKSSFFTLDIFIYKIIDMTMIGFDPRHGLEVIILQLPLIGVYLCSTTMKTHVISEEGIISMSTPTFGPFTSYSIMLDPFILGN